MSSFAVVDLAGATVECNRRGPPGKPRRLPHVDRPVFPRDSKMFCSNTVTTNPSEKIQLENDRTCVLMRPRSSDKFRDEQALRRKRFVPPPERKGKEREGKEEERNPGLLGWTRKESNAELKVCVGTSTRRASANEKCQRLWGVGQERETPLIKQSMSLPLAEIYFPI